MKLNAKQLRSSTLEDGKTQQGAVTRHKVILVLDNVQDTYNIGSFFRLADAFAIEKVILCGSVVTPPNLKIHRASIGTWKWVPWEHTYTTSEALESLKNQGYKIIAIEQKEGSVPIEKLAINTPVALVLGNETHGVGEDTQKYADMFVELPMYGVNVSLNVLIAGTIAVHEIVKKIHK